MEGQMTIFEWLEPDRIDPIMEVAKHDGLYWTTSRQTLIDLYAKRPGIKDFARAVREEYCPYGFAGHYGGNDEPNTMLGWDMYRNKIKTKY